MRTSFALRTMRIAFVLGAVALILVTQQSSRAAEKSSTPAVGGPAPEFALDSLQGEAIRLSELRKSGPVVLVVLRGYPGYQCPVCNAQVGQFLAKAEKFQAAKANIVLVYPGAADGLKAHAEEFVRGKTLPTNVYLVLDPAFKFTTAYGLRWDKKNETAYPSTFLIDDSGKVRFAKISMSHGDRASAEEVLQAMRKI